MYINKYKLFRSVLKYNLTHFALYTFIFFFRSQITINNTSRCITKLTHALVCHWHTSSCKYVFILIFILIRICWIGQIKIIELLFIPSFVKPTKAFHNLLYKVGYLRWIPRLNFLKCLYFHIQLAAKNIEMVSLRKKIKPVNEYKNLCSNTMMGREQRKISCNLGI